MASISSHVQVINDAQDTQTTSSDSETDDSSDLDHNDLKLDLKNSLIEFYQGSKLSNLDAQDEQLQAAALCQFMDILNDLDEVLDKSLLACLDGELDNDSVSSYDNLDHNRFEHASQSNVYELHGIEDSHLLAIEDHAHNAKYDITGNKHDNKSISNDDLRIGNEVSRNDDDDVICKITELSEAQSSQDVSEYSDNLTSDISDPQGIAEEIQNPLQRAKSLTDLQPRLDSLTDDLRSSMRRLDPVALPALGPENCELTLPVILFLEHHVNMRPTSAPIQLLSSNVNEGPLIIGRRMLTNRSPSLQSPEGSDVNGTWMTGLVEGSSSSGSSESLNMNEETPPLPPPRVTSANLQRIQRSEEEEDQTDRWPHHMSSMLACLSCTVGIFNLSRFAIFSVHFGANFLIQFLILSLIVGIPLFTLYLCLGQMLSSGPMDMWKISPIFQGVGISLLICQIVIGIYSILGVSWVFVYFRDSFITENDKYRWSLPWDFFSQDATSSKYVNMTHNIQETIPQYFHYEVLQRSPGQHASYGTIKFQLAFNLAVVWMVVFVGLSKGLRSYGKAVYALTFLPVGATLILCTKLLTLTPHDTVTNIFSETEWSEFFTNSNSWSAAAQEVFLTWGLLGSCIMQLTSQKSEKNKNSKTLQRESACIIAFTFSILILASFLANTCVQILKDRGYFYLPSSYETIQSSQFLWPRSVPLPGAIGSTKWVSNMAHYGSLVGTTVWRVGTTSSSQSRNIPGSHPKQLSGWQPLQLATELVPATLASLSTEELSPAWAVIFYFILIMFGIAQQLAIWHCVIMGIMAINSKVLKAWETTITFLSCVFGLLVGLFFTTDAGIYIIHYIDYVWVGSWLHCLLQVVLICAVFVVRGRPYSGDVVVTAMYTNDKKLSATLGALLSFTWNVIIPVIMIALCVVDFRTGKQRQLYSWRRTQGYWPVWARQIAVFFQQSILLIVPLCAFIQTWRYLSKGPTDILERIQNLYRPRIGPNDSARPATEVPRIVNEVPVVPPPDPPPKYTPPPSYSTATGARLLNTLRRSFRTLRRMTTSLTERNDTNNSSQLPITLSESIDNERIISLESQPPDYSGVYTAPSIIVTDETDAHDNTRDRRNDNGNSRDRRNDNTNNRRRNQSDRQNQNLNQQNQNTNTRDRRNQNSNTRELQNLNFTNISDSGNRQSQNLNSRNRQNQNTRDRRQNPRERYTLPTLRDNTFIFPITNTNLNLESHNNTPTVSTDPNSSTPQRNSAGFSRNFLRRSFAGKSETKNLRSSLRRSFKYSSALSTSHEDLVRGAEPISNTVAMAAILNSDETSNGGPVI